MKTLLLSLVLFAQVSITGLEIRVVDAAQEPVPSVHLTLNTYTYNNGDAILRETVECDTDTDGACSLLLENPNQKGMQYGTLKIGEYGYRDLIWAGGMIKLNIPLDQVGSGREAAPYDFQPNDGGVTVIERKFPFFALLTLFFLGIMFWLVYKYARSQDGNE